MIIPNKDIKFEDSVLYLSIVIYRNICNYEGVEDIYNKHENQFSHIDIDNALLFLFSIGIDIESEVENVKKSI